MERFMGLMLLSAMIFSGATYLLFRLVQRWRQLILIPTWAAFILAGFYFYRSLGSSEGLLDLAQRLVAILFAVGGLSGAITAVWLKYRRGRIT